MSIHLISVVLLCLLYCGVSAGPTCFKCDDVTDPNSCSTEVRCQSDEGCFASRVLDSSLQFKYLYGCQKRVVCEVLAASSQAVGRRQTSGARVERDIPVCTQCCYTDRCNQHLCQEHTAPAFTTRPADVTAMPGERVVLHCSGFGSPPPEIAWGFVDASGFPRLLDSVGEIVISADHRTLTINNLTSDLTGAYTCRLKNALGTQTSVSTVRLQAPIRPTVVLQPASAWILQGLSQDVVFSCSFTGVPTPQVFWFHSGPDGKVQELHAGFTTTGASSNLTIADVKVSDSGTYTCAAKNNQGTEEVSATLTVQTPTTTTSPQPTIELHPKFARALEGYNLDQTFHCNVTGLPSPHISWSFERSGGGTRHSLSSGIVTSGSISDLTIKDVQTYNSGTYYCKASGSLGTVEASGSLTVLAKSTHTL